MSKDNPNKEPWNQPIYEDETEVVESRSNKKNKPKTGNTLFITMLVVLLLAIIILLVYFFQLQSAARKTPATEKPIVVQVSSTSSKKPVSSSTSSSSSATKPSETKESTEKKEPNKNNNQNGEQEKPAEEKPAEEKPKNPDNQAATPNQPASGSTYTVQPGDNLYRIALNNGLTVDQLMALNGLTSNDIVVNQVLKVSQ